VYLEVPGIEASNVHYALEYLRRVNSGERVALGKRVIVIGGGSVAIDVARTARRLGSKDVHIVCLETRDLASRDRMPALDPEIALAEEEGIVIHPRLGVRKIVAENGKAVGIDTKQCMSVRETDGRFNPQFDESSAAMRIHGESIVVAIGQVDDQTLRTGEKGGESGRIFSGGDMDSGPSTVIQAVASAQKTVRDIEDFLSGGTAEIDAGESEYAESCFESIPRAESRELSVAERVERIDVEDVPGLQMGEVETEARRCVSCGCLAVGPSDLAVALVALDASIVTTKRIMTAKAFFTATATCSTMLEPDELIREVQIPKPPKGARQTYRKFTLRKPLDFAVVSVAAVIASENGICSDARIALGAVAPAPMRAGAAETALKGRSLSEEAAAEAARLALDGAMPLSMNAYKAEIARVLIKRSILGLPE
jgi:CO/xanthine dehydrogenase FAD-binding subunit